MTVRSYSVPLTTNGDGDATGYTPFLSGYIKSIRYVKTDFANGVDFVLTAEATGQLIWDEDNVNGSAIRYPRAGTHTNAGVAALYAADGESVNDRIALGRDRVKVVVASGGDTKTGTIIVTTDDGR